MFRETLKQLRESKHLNQKELAHAIYISPSAISQYENGRTMPSRENLESLAKFFGVSADYLLGTSSAADLEERLNQEYCRGVTAAALLDKCINIKGERRRVLLQIVEDLEKCSRGQGD